MDFDVFAITVIILAYSLASIGVFMGALSLRARLKVWSNRLMLAGFVLHAIYIIAGLVSFAFMKRASDFDLGFLMLLIGWGATFAYLCVWHFLKRPFFSLTAAPLALLLFIFSMRFRNAESVLPKDWGGFFLAMHVCSLFLSIGLLALAFGAGLLFIYVDRKLKKKSPQAVISRDLPALSTYDSVNRIAVAVGFPLFTLGVVAGFVWLPIVQLSAEQPKVLVSLFIWFLFALLFYQRQALSFKGKKTAVMAVWVFLLSVASLVAEHLLTDHSLLILP